MKRLGILLSMMLMVTCFTLQADVVYANAPPGEDPGMVMQLDQPQPVQVVMIVSMPAMEKNASFEYEKCDQDPFMDVMAMEVIQKYKWPFIDNAYCYSFKDFWHIDYSYQLKFPNIQNGNLFTYWKEPVTKHRI